LSHLPHLSLHGGGLGLELTDTWCGQALARKSAAPRHIILRDDIELFRVPTCACALSMHVDGFCPHHGAVLDVRIVLALTAVPSDPMRSLKRLGGRWLLLRGHGQGQILMQEDGRVLVVVVGGTRGNQPACVGSGIAVPRLTEVLEHLCVSRLVLAVVVLVELGLYSLGEDGI
jgi:hypothetical protein